MGILITGGGGYLGSRVAEAALADGCQVRIFDRFCFLPCQTSPEELFDSIALPSHLQIVVGDIRRLQEHPDLFDGIESVIHLAGLSSDPTCDLDPEMACDVNVESTRELARKAIEAGVKRFVFVSTCAVYGQGVFELLDEESPANPVSVFAKTKQEAEEALLGLHSDAFEVVVARMSTLFGRSRRMRFDLAVNHMVATALRQGRILVRGGGNQWRPFIHVDDGAAALLALVQAPPEKVAGQIFNIGADDQNISVLDLAHLVARQLKNTSIEIAKDDDDLRTYRVRFGKLKRALHFSCARTIGQGIAEVQHLLASTDINPFEEQHFNVDRMKRLRSLPVDAGGEPVAARFIPLSRPSLGVEEEQSVLEVLRTGWLTSGPQVKTFENMFAETVQAPHAVAACSCTAALHLCLAAMGVKAGDEVITSPITWASTGNTLLNMGAAIRFIDVDPKTLNMDPRLLEAAITPRTRVIMPVHIAGRPCDMDAIRSIAERYGIPVLEDAAHALGASYKGEAVGARGPACFSFYAIKNITTMEGGMITLQNAEMAHQLKLLSANGMSATAWDRYGRSAVAAPQEVVVPGYKYALGNVNAAMGIAQLKKFNAFAASRRRIADMYRAVLADLDEIELPEVEDTVEHAWHLFIIRLKLDKITCTRNEIADDLRRENIGTGVHFYGLHLHQYYRETLGMQAEDLPMATRVSQEILSLPLHPQLTDKHMNEVVTALKKVLHYRKKRHA